MSFTYAPATLSGKVRLRISDTDEAHPIFDDDEIAVFLEVEGEDWRRASALALETIAGNEAMVQKVITYRELQTDGAKLGAELRAQAKDLRAQADSAAVTANANAVLTFVPATYGAASEGDEYSNPPHFITRYT